MRQVCNTLYTWNCAHLQIKTHRYDGQQHHNYVFVSDGYEPFGSSARLIVIILSFSQTSIIISV